MDIVVHILLIVPFLMGMAIGYVFKDWIRAYKKKRKIKEELLDKKNLDQQDKIRDRIDRINEDYYSMNYHSTSTQGPPRRSAMATLEDLLEGALKNENYEIAAKLRDRINKQKNNEDNNSC